MKESLAGLTPKAEAVRRFRAAREEETRLHDLLAHLTGGQVLGSYALRDLSHRIGPDVRLTQLEVLEPQAATPSPGAPAERPSRLVRLTGLHPEPQTEDGWGTATPIAHRCSDRFVSRAARR